MNQTIHIEPS